MRKDQHEFLEKLFTEQYKTLFRHANSILRNTHLAEVAVQETFAIACEKIATLLSHPNPIGALRLTLVNVIKRIQTEQYQSRKRTLSMEVVQPETLGISDELNPTVEYEGIISTEEIEIVEKLYIKGYTYQELADEMGVPLSTVGMKAKRAKEKFRKNFKE